MARRYSRKGSGFWSRDISLGRFLGGVKLFSPSSRSKRFGNYFKAGKGRARPRRKTTLF